MSDGHARNQRIGRLPRRDGSVSHLNPEGTAAIEMTIGWNAPQTTAAIEMTVASNAPLFVCGCLTACVEPAPHGATKRPCLAKRWVVARDMVPSG